MERSKIIDDIVKVYFAGGNWQAYSRISDNPAILYAAERIEELEFIIQPKIMVQACNYTKNI